MSPIDRTKGFRITHYVNATPQRVWQAWTDPEDISQWWHLPGGTTPAESLEFDVRVGGSYIYVSIDDESKDRTTSGGVFTEVVPPTQLGFTWGAPGLDPASLPEVTVTVEETTDGSYVTFELVGLDGAPDDDGAYDTWDQAIIRLKEFVV